MEPPFWTVGAIPAGLLDRLALPRPDALATVVATLREGRMAAIGAPRGTGRTTLALQAAAATGRPAVLVDATQAEHAAKCGSLVARALDLDPDLDPDRLRHHLTEAKDPIIVLDGAKEGVAKDFASSLPKTDIIHIGEEGVTPDPVAEEVAKAFLQRRSHTAGIGWSRAALDLVVKQARGQVDALQWIAQTTLAEALVRRVETIDAEAALEGATVAAEHLPQAYALPLSQLAGARLALLKAMTRRPKEGPSAWARLAEIPVNAASVHLLRLVESGVVEREGRGQYRIRSPLIELHIQGRYGNVAQFIPGP